MLDNREVVDLLARAVRHLCTLDSSQKPLLRGLADNRWGVVLAQVVEGMDPSDATDRAVLEKLLGTGTQIAGMARERLQKAGGAPYWMGAFEADPLAGLPEEKTQELLPVVRRWLELMQGNERTDEVIEEQIALLARMPAGAALGALRRLVHAGRCLSRGGDVLVAVAGHEGAETVVCDLLSGSWDRRLEVHDWDGKLAGKLPVEFRRRLCAELLRRLVPMKPASLADAGSPAWHCSSLLSAMWPQEDDPRAVAELLLSWGEGEGEIPPLMFLNKPIERAGPGRGWVEPLFAACVEAGFRGRFRLLAGPLATLARGLPQETVMALARRGLEQREAGPLLVWAVAQVATHQADALPAFYDDPLLRSVLIHHHLEGEILRRARADMHDDRLSAEEVSQVVDACVRPSDHVPWHKYGSSIGADRRPGLDEDDWAAIRRVRKALPVERSARLHGLVLFHPPGEWLAEDLAFFEAALRERIRDDNLTFVEWLAFVAVHKPARCLLAPLEQVLDDFEGMEGSPIEDACRALRRHFGLEPSDEGSGTPPDGAEWT